MGRKKIEIKRITDDRNRQGTFATRHKGLVKKAYELSELCGCEVVLVMRNVTPSNDDRLYTFASHDLKRSLTRYYTEGGASMPVFTNDHYAPLYLPGGSKKDKEPVLPTPGSAAENTVRRTLQLGTALQGPSNTFSPHGSISSFDGASTSSAGQVAPVVAAPAPVADNRRRLSTRRSLQQTAGASEAQAHVRSRMTARMNGLGGSTVILPDGRVLHNMPRAGSEMAGWTGAQTAGGASADQQVQWPSDGAAAAPGSAAPAVTTSRTSMSNESPTEDVDPFKFTASEEAKNIISAMAPNLGGDDMESIDALSQTWPPPGQGGSTRRKKNLNIKIPDDAAPPNAIRPANVLPSPSSSVPFSHPYVPTASPRHAVSPRASGVSPRYGRSPASAQFPGAPPFMAVSPGRAAIRQGPAFPLPAYSGPGQQVHTVRYGQVRTPSGTVHSGVLMTPDSARTAAAAAAAAAPMAPPPSTTEAQKKQ